jgi:hypothetical protein
MPAGTDSLLKSLFGSPKVVSATTLVCTSGASRESPLCATSAP